MHAATITGRSKLRPPKVMSVGAPGRVIAEVTSLRSSASLGSSRAERVKRTSGFTRSTPKLAHTIRQAGGGAKSSGFFGTHHVRSTVSES